MIEFVHDEVTYTLRADGSLSGTSATGNVSGSWTAESPGGDNELTLSVDGRDPFAVPVKYAFFTDDVDYLNALRIEVASDGGNAATALLGGKIVIDNHQDIEFQLPGGAKLVVYGTLAFKNGYETLEIDLKGGGTTTIEQVAILLDSEANNAPDERDLLKVDATTEWLDPETGDMHDFVSVIELSGRFEPREGEIVFVGSIEGTSTFDVTIAAKSYKVFRGGLRLYSEDGQTGFELDLLGQFSFRGHDGTFRVSLGFSDTKDLEAQVQFNFGGPETDETGKTGLKAKATFNLGGSAAAPEVEFDLEGRFEIGQHDRLVTFKLEADYADNALSLDFSGTVKIDEHKQLTYQINYDGNDVEIGLKFEDTKRDFWIEILAGSSGFKLSFFVRFTFPSAGAPLQAGEPEKLTADGAVAGV